MTITCCANPDVARGTHSSYCVTTRRHTPGRFGTGDFAGWSDDTVMRSMHEQADLCVRVMSLPEDERSRPGPKGAASPEQAATLNAVITMRLHAEATRRGLLA